MIGFVLPFKPRSQSKNWEKDCALLEATIGSLLRQQSGDYKIYVVYSDKPGININSDKVMLLAFPYPFVTSDKITSAKEILHHFKHDNIMLERRWDKSRKIMYGCVEAIKDGCDYLMSVDADDLISDQLVKYITERTKEIKLPGFYINKGYLYNYGSSRMISINEGMQNFNGSTHILHASLIKETDFENGQWIDFNLFTSHGWILYRLKEELGIELEPVPFPAVIYVAHGGNISDVSSQKGLKKLKHWAKIILRGKRINNIIKKEFNLQ